MKSAGPDANGTPAVEFGQRDSSVGSSATQAAEVKEYDLIDSLHGEWLKLPHAVMKSVGPATQTLAGFANATSKNNRETFRSVARLADSARLPVATVRKHLARLEVDGWVTNRGREQTRAGRPRRTCTIAMTAKGAAQFRSDGSAYYGFLPWWACIGRVTWSEKAVLSVVLARLLTLKAAAERNGAADTEEVWGEIANMGDDANFRFSLDHLSAATGLTRQPIVAAKASLSRFGIVSWRGSDTYDKADILYPRDDFRVKVVPIGNNRVSVKF
jgi:DNA-binding MarR family transcriptional regulator